jgi:lysophospholipase L1-like esterase
MNSGLNQADGLHPNEKGVAIMVENVAPEIEDALED